MTASSSEEDEDCFKQADGLLMALKTMLERKFSGNMPKKKPWYVRDKFDIEICFLCLY